MIKTKKVSDSVRVTFQAREKMTEKDEIIEEVCEKIFGKWCKDGGWKNWKDFSEDLPEDSDKYPSQNELLGSHNYNLLTIKNFKKAIKKALSLAENCPDCETNVYRIHDLEQDIQSLKDEKKELIEKINDIIEKADGFSREDWAEFGDIILRRLKEVKK